MNGVLLCSFFYVGRRKIEAKLLGTPLKVVDLAFADGLVVFGLVDVLERFAIGEHAVEDDRDFVCCSGDCVRASVASTHSSVEVAQVTVRTCE